MNEFVKVGASFRRVMTDLTVETAEVLDLFSDAYGIPHVRYELSIARPGRAVYVTGPRTIALRAFGQNFVPPETARA
ncbi:MAG TPA: hypothetical protein VEJ16_09920 [Alphaproteobacteria bacterium]|nr:hypothetical protein [Alphaproteobacteria bacterium]